MQSTKIVAVFSGLTVFAFTLLLLTGYTNPTAPTIMLVPTVTP